MTPSLRPQSPARAAAALGLVAALAAGAAPAHRAHPSRVAKAARGQGLTAAQVKAALQKTVSEGVTYKGDDRDATARITSWDSPVRIAPPTFHHFYALGDKTVYPVKVDYTITTVHPTRIAVWHYKNGIYNFYKDGFGDWTFSIDQPWQVTMEPDRPK